MPIAIFSVLIALVAGIDLQVQARAEALLRANDGRLTWAGLPLGATLREVQSVLGSTLTLRPAVNDTGTGVGDEARVRIQGMHVTLTFVRQGNVQRLEAMFIAFPEARNLQSIVGELKRRVPGLRYVSSIHDQGAAESLAAKPLYALQGEPPQQVLIGPTEGLWISRGCTD
jgi:hypothetical protein